MRGLCGRLACLMLLSAALAVEAPAEAREARRGEAAKAAAAREGGRGLRAPAQARRPSPVARAAPLAAAGSVGLAGATLAAGPGSAASPGSAQAEARLLAIHRLIGEGRMAEARAQAERLVRDYPQFQLGHMLLGDLLSAQAGRFGASSVLPSRLNAAQGEALLQLRDEARQRLLALQDRPPAGRLPSAFLALPATVRHAVAVDASRHRLYLFERSERGLRLVADHYVSLGKSGVDKRVEGDQRTPVGVYFTTSRLDGRQLADLYGTGALTLNYPNEVDRLKGRTGSGIWLHGTPAANYARAPLSTDGCIVLSNPDMQRLMQTVAPQGTPVVVAHKLDWVLPEAAERSNRGFGEALRAWWQARDLGDASRLAAFYAASASPLAEAPTLRRVSARTVPDSPQRFQSPKDLSIFTWRDQLDHAVVTFGDVGRGARTGVVRRQYWTHDGQRWRIVHESLIG